MIEWFLCLDTQWHVAFAAAGFWLIRFFIGHKLYYWTTCLNRFKLRDKWYKKWDFHDWEYSYNSGSGESASCKRCGASRQRNYNNKNLYEYSFRDRNKYKVNGY